MQSTVGDVERPHGVSEDVVFPKPNADGEGDLPLINGTALLAVRLALGLKRIRIEKGWQIKDVAAKSGLDVATLSRLENGRIFNPRLDTLSRYALAIGYEIEANFVEVAPEYREGTEV